MENLSRTIKFGIYSFLGIAAFFLIMKLFGLEHLTWLRAFNILIVLYFSNRLARLNFTEDTEDNYVSSLLSLLVANGITMIASAVAFAIYAGLIDPAFLHRVKGGVLFADGFTLQHAIISILMEGAAGSLIVSFVLMQYWKNMKPKSKVETGKSYK
jgi:hypothetical protein